MTFLPRRAAAAASLLALLLVATACGDVSINFSSAIEASGDVVSTSFDLDDFDEVEVQSAFTAFITVGDATDIEILANESFVDELDVRVEDDTLKIGMKSGVNLRNGTLEARVQLPFLVRAKVSGASTATVVGAVGPDQAYEATGASELTIEGTGSTVRIDASGASDIDVRLDDVVAVDVELSGASTVGVRHAETVTGELSGASDLTVPPDAIVDVDTSGASDVNRR